MSYPETPGYSNLTTSKAAAEKVDYLNQREKVLEYIRQSGGATSFETANVLGILHNSVSGRCSDLINAGKIVDSGVTRINEFGSQCIVFVIAPAGTQPIIRHKTYKELLEENAQLKRQHARCICPFKDSL